MYAVRAPARRTRGKGILMKRFVLMAFVGLLFALHTSAQRLPGNVLPESYDLAFQPDLPSATFSGKETIHVRLLQAASSITVGGATQTPSVLRDDKSETATLKVANIIPAGPAEIHIRFKGILNDKLR